MTASLALGGGAAAPAAASAADAQVQVGVGQADAFSRIEFRGGQPRAVHRDGQDLVLDFGPVAAPNLSLLRVDPPRYLTTARATRTASGLQIRLTLAQGVEAKIGRADGATYVNLSPGAATPAPADQTPQRSDSPVPASGVVKMHAALQAGALKLRFDWRTPLGAAVFRRADAIWVVFDARARLDLSELPEGLPQARKIEPVPARDVTAVRILAPASIQPTMTADGASWTLTLSPVAAAPPPAVEVKPDPATGGLAATMAGGAGVFWLDDPAVGDRLAVVTARAPSKGVASARRLVDADIFASAQGLALVPLAEDLTVRTDGDVVRIGRPSGMQLSADVHAPNAAPPAPPTLPQLAAWPSLVDFDGWSQTGPRGFMGRYQSLLQGAADEGAKGKGASTQARFGFARFLLGSELSFETVGVLDLLAKTDPEVVSTAQFRGLRGAARAMTGRYKEAQADFSSPAVADDPAAAVWRGYVAARIGDYTGARQAFASGRVALDRFAPAWRARFLLADAEAALVSGDGAGAFLALQQAAALKPQGVDADRLTLDEGRLAQAQGRADQALALYKTAEASSYGGVSAPALLHATEVLEQQGRISPADATAALDQVRFRWRGDATELEAARALGRLYIAQGHYREALEALKGAQTASPDLPGAAAVQGDLSAAFRSLFLDGGADGLPPVQALALFFDFKDLTPIGADGDTMVRKLARRLVDVDLLDQAAQLLSYQAANRLDGVGRAQVDTDVALIQVMNRQPEQALDALNVSRTTLVPAALQSQRRVIQARALMALGRYDDALEFLDSDNSADAAAARAEIAWKKHDWPTAGRLMEVALGDRFKRPAPLSPVEEGELLRAAIAYSLASDEAGLARLRIRYAGFEATAHAPDMLKVALAGLQPGQADPGLWTSTGADSFPGWVQAMKARLLTSGAAA